MNTAEGFRANIKGLSKRIGEHNDKLGKVWSTGKENYVKDWADFLERVQVMLSEYECQIVDKFNNGTHGDMLNEINSLMEKFHDRLIEVREELENGTGWNNNDSVVLTYWKDFDLLQNECNEFKEETEKLLNEAENKPTLVESNVSGPVVITAPILQAFDISTNPRSEVFGKQFTEINQCIGKLKEMAMRVWGPFGDKEARVTKWMNPVVDYLESVVDRLDNYEIQNRTNFNDEIRASTLLDLNSLIKELELKRTALIDKLQESHIPVTTFESMVVEAKLLIEGVEKLEEMLQPEESISQRCCSQS